MKETGLAGYRPKNFQWRAEGRVGVLTLDRPENLVTVLNGRTNRLPVGGVKTLIVTPRGIRAAV